MATGVVKRLVSDKGFGFIKPDDGGADLFFHRSAIRYGRFEDLVEGTRVRYDVGTSPKGPRAEDVRIG